MATMILEVLEGSTPKIDRKDVRYSRVLSYIYGNPLTVEIGVLHFDIKSLTIGKEYQLTLRIDRTINLVYAGISKHPMMIGQHTTQLIFMYKDFWKMEHNLYPHTQSVLGIPLKHWVEGGKNQLEVFILEMRKKGLHLALDDNFKPKTQHSSEYKGMSPLYFPKTKNKIKEIKLTPRKRNYCVIEPVEQYAQTKNGYGLPILLVGEKKDVIKGLDTFIKPKWEIEFYFESNWKINIGKCVMFKQKKYCVMEKNSFFSKRKEAMIYILGEITD